MRKKLTKLISLLLSMIMLMGTMPLASFGVIAAADIGDPIAISDFRIYEELSYGKGTQVDEKTGVLTPTDEKYSGIYAEAHLSGEVSKDAEVQYVWFYAAKTDSVSKFEIGAMTPFGFSPWDFKCESTLEAFAQFAIENKLGNSSNAMPLYDFDYMTGKAGEKYFGGKTLSVGCLAYVVQDGKIVAESFVSTLALVDFSGDSGSQNPVVSLSDSGYNYIADRVYDYDSIAITASINNMEKYPGATFQWYIADNEAGDGLTAIDGATDATYECPLPAMGKIAYYTCAAIYEGQVYMSEQFKVINRAIMRRIGEIAPVEISAEADSHSVGVPFTEDGETIYNRLRGVYFIVKAYEVSSPDSYDGAVFVGTQNIKTGTYDNRSVYSPELSVATGETKYFYLDVTYLGETETAGDEYREETCRTNIFSVTRRSASGDVILRLTRKWTSYRSDGNIYPISPITQFVGAQNTFAYLEAFSKTVNYSEKFTMRIRCSETEACEDGAILEEFVFTDLAGKDIREYLAALDLKFRVPSDKEGTVWLYAEWENECGGDKATGRSESIKVTTEGKNEDYFDFDPKTGTVYGYRGSEETVVIPATIGGVAVKKIGGFSYDKSDTKYKRIYARSSFRRVIISEGIEEINDHAFFCQEDLEEVVFPSTLTKIGEYAFKNCNKLTKLDFESITGSLYIDMWAFENCSGITHMICPSADGANVNAIGCEGAKNLWNITNVRNLKARGGPVGFIAQANNSSNPDGYSTEDYQFVFYYHPDKDAYSIASINYLTSDMVEYRVFNGSECLVTINKLPTTYRGKRVIGVGSPFTGDFIHDFGGGVSGLYDEIEAFTKENSLNSTWKYLIGIELPEGYIYIGPRAFYGGSDISFVSLPTTIVTIGDEAFRCDNRTGSSAEFVISGFNGMCSLNYIGARAFYGEIKGLEGDLVFNHDAVIGEYAFASVHDVFSYGWWHSELWQYNKIGSLTFKGSVTIGEHAFAHSHELKSITFGGDANVGYRAFYESLNLHTVTLAEGKSLTLSQDAFDRCFAIENTNIVYEKISDGIVVDKTRGYSHFRWTKAFPNVVDTIDSYTAQRYLRDGARCIQGYKSSKTNYKYIYYLGDGDTEVVFPGLCGEYSVYAITADVMKYCGNTEYSLVIGEGITYIEPRQVQSGTVEWWMYTTNYASPFENCIAVSLPDSLTKIPEAAFYKCKITELKLPSTVTEIGRYAFCDCPITGTVEIPAGITYLYEAVFKGGKIDTLILHEGLKNIYPCNFADTPTLSRIITVGKNDGTPDIQTFPDSLTNIGRGAFCIDYSDRYNPDIPVQGLRGTLVLPEKITLNNNCFEGQTALTKIVAHCNSIWAGSYSDNISLGESGYYGCFYIQPYQYDDLYYFPPFWNCLGIEEIDLSQSSCTVIPDNFFCTSPKLRSVRLPATVTVIGANVVEARNDILDASVFGVLPEGLVTYLFKTSGSIVLPSTVQCIDDTIFDTHSVITFLGKDTPVHMIWKSDTWDSRNHRYPAKGVALPSSIPDTCLIRCYKDSFIHKWCLENSIKYELLDGDSAAKLTVTVNSPDGRIYPSSFASVVWYDRTTGREVWIGQDTYLVPAADAGHVYECTVTFGRELVNKYQIPLSVTFVFDTSKEDFKSDVTLDIAERTNVTIKGRFTNSDIDGFIAALINETTGESYPITPAADGSFELTDIPRIDGYSIVMDSITNSERLYERTTVKVKVTKKLGLDGKLDIGDLTIKEADAMTSLPCFTDALNTVSEITATRLSDGVVFKVTYRSAAKMLTIEAEKGKLRRGDVLKLESKYNPQSGYYLDGVIITLPGKYAAATPLDIQPKKLGLLEVRGTDVSSYIFDSLGNFVTVSTHAYLLPGTYTVITVSNLQSYTTPVTLNAFMLQLDEVAFMGNYSATDLYSKQEITISDYGKNIVLEETANKPASIYIKTWSAMVIVYSELTGKLVAYEHYGKNLYLTPGKYKLIAINLRSFSTPPQTYDGFRELGYSSDSYISEDITVTWNDRLTFDKPISCVIGDIEYSFASDMSRIDPSGRVPVYITFKYVRDSKNKNQLKKFYILENDNEFAFIPVGGKYVDISGADGTLENIDIYRGSSSSGASLAFETTASEGTIYMYAKADGSSFNLYVNRVYVCGMALMRQNFSVMSPTPLTNSGSGMLEVKAQYSGKATAEIYVDGELCGEAVELVTYGLGRNFIPYSFKTYSDGSSEHNMFVVIYDENGEELWTSDTYTVTHTNRTVSEPQKLHVRMENQYGSITGNIRVEEALFDIASGKHNLLKIDTRYLINNEYGKLAKDISFYFALEMSNPAGATDVTLVMECNKSVPYTRDVRLFYNSETGMFEGSVTYPENTATRDDIPFGFSVEYRQTSKLTEEASFDYQADIISKGNKQYADMLKAIEEEKKEYTPVNLDTLRFLMDNTENSLTEEDKREITDHYTKWNEICDIYGSIWSALGDYASSDAAAGNPHGDMQDILDFVNGTTGNLAAKTIDDSVTAQKLLDAGFRAMEQNGKTFYVYSGAAVCLDDRIMYYDLTSSAPIVMMASLEEEERNVESDYWAYLDKARSIIAGYDFIVNKLCTALELITDWLDELIYKVSEYVLEERALKDRIIQIKAMELREAMKANGTVAVSLKDGDMLKLLSEKDMPVPTKADVYTLEEAYAALEATKKSIAESNVFFRQYAVIRENLFDMTSTAAKRLVQDKTQKIVLMLAKFYGKTISKALSVVGVVVNFGTIIYDAMSLVRDLIVIKGEVEDYRASAKRYLEMLDDAAENGCVKTSFFSDVDRIRKKAREAYIACLDEINDLLRDYAVRMAERLVTLWGQVATTVISLAGTVTLLSNFVADSVIQIIDLATDIIYDYTITSDRYEISDAMEDLSEATYEKIDLDCMDKINKPKKDPKKDNDKLKKDITDDATRTLIDPAGFVYEAVHSNRVKGLTAKVFYKGEDGNPVFWSEAPVYGETNPQITNDYGEFAWMTPIGDWLVIIYDEDGNEIGNSRNDPAAVDGWLPVPPPQLSVYIGIVSDQAPTVDKIGASTGKVQVTFSQYMDIAYLLAHPELITVTQDGVAVPVTFVFSDREERPAADGVFYGRVLEMRRADGKAFSGDNIKVKIGAGIKNYAGTAMGTDYESDALSARQTAAEIEHSYPNRLVIKKGTTETIALRVKDDNGLCMAGVTVTVRASVDGIFTFEAMTGVTDENGRVTFTLTGADAGDTVFTFTADNGVSAEMNARVVTEPAEKPKKPTANLGDFIIVSAGTKLILSCETEGAIIYYTTDNTCPCTDGEGRKIYSGEIALTESGFYRIAAYTEDGGYSERLNLHIIVIACVDENGDHLCDICGEKISDCIDEDKNHKCDICGKTLSEHSYGAEWKRGAEKHWHECTYCGEKKDEAAHSMDAEEKCTVCGYKKGAYGDLNGDGKIGAADITLMRKYIASYEVEIDLSAADLNGDGKINAVDLTMLRKYIAGYDVVFGKKTSQ